MRRTRTVAWVKEDPFGVELADATVSSDSLSATGIAIGTEDGPYRLDYELETGPRFTTSRLRVTARGDGWHRELDLRRSTRGEWQADADLPELATALDCDLGLSPLTNSMPVLREDLLRAQSSVELVLAWVSVPDLTVLRARQRYTGLGNGVVRFEDLDSTFTADIRFDADGLVLEYPGLARRLSERIGV